MSPVDLTFRPPRCCLRDPAEGVSAASDASVFRFKTTATGWNSSSPWRRPGLKGGHFAAWEEPELFATEIRAPFKSLR